MGQQNRSTTRMPHILDRTAARDRGPASKAPTQHLPAQRPPRPQQIPNQPCLASEVAAPVHPKAQPTASEGSSGGEVDGECVPGTIHKSQHMTSRIEDDQNASRELSFPENAGERARTHTHTQTHTHTHTLMAPPSPWVHDNASHAFNKHKLSVVLGGSGDHCA